MATSSRDRTIRTRASRGRRRRGHALFAATSLLLLLLLLAVLPNPIRSIPMTYTIQHRATECLYDKVGQGEHATMSVFVSSGNELRASAVFEGPVADESVESGVELQRAVAEYTKRGGRPQKGKGVKIDEIVDFEHLELPVEDDDDDDKRRRRRFEEDDEEERDERDRHRKDAERARREMERKKRRERRMRERPRAEGEPFQRTLHIEMPGWYRVCVTGRWNQITAEIEMRKSSELGPVDEQTGHVPSYEFHEMIEEDRFLDEKDPELEGAIKEDDLEETRTQLKTLNKLLNEIKTQQQEERHTLSVHATTNEHSHSRMVLGSLLETVVYMVVTSFQVFTIRKWFSGNPMLGV